MHQRFLSGSVLSIFLTALIVAPPSVSQAESAAPLSVIDWLGTQSAPLDLPPLAPVKPDEPAVASSATRPAVSVQPLNEGGLRDIGLVPGDISGLPVNLWSGSDLAELEHLLANLPDLHLPAAQSLLYTVLLAEAGAPGGKSSNGEALMLARVRQLVSRGALDPAQSLIEQAGVTTSAEHFRLWMQISLLTGTEDRACDVLHRMPHLNADVDVRIFCDGRLRRWEDAALALGTARALDLLPELKLTLLDRFLNPESSEGPVPLPRPKDMDPLNFRLFETIGERILSGPLPRPYAVADLRDLAGWKSQIEAAERLARAGSLPDNRLLGLYTERRPAASGGVWDRVAGLQRFETALASASTDAVTKTLPPIWALMEEVELQVPFATLFAQDLAAFSLTGSAAQIAREIQYLSPAYEQMASKETTDGLAAKIAQGDVPAQRPSEGMQGALYDGFHDAPPRADLVAMVRQNRLGEAILHVLNLLHDGASGDAKHLSDALSTLRALGLEDTARRAALQILFLEQS